MASIRTQCTLANICVQRKFCFRSALYTAGAASDSRTRSTHTHAHCTYPSLLYLRLCKYACTQTHTEATVLELWIIATGGLQLCTPAPNGIVLVYYGFGTHWFPVCTSLSSFAIRATLIVCVCVCYWWHTDGHGILPIVAHGRGSFFTTLSHGWRRCWWLRNVPWNRTRGTVAFIRSLSKTLKLFIRFIINISKADIKYCTRDDAAFHFCA